MDNHSIYLLRLADSALILGQRLGEWVGHAPALEEDLALANLSLDYIGQSRLLLAYTAEREGGGSDEDTLAYLRSESEYRNLNLVEQTNGDFGFTIARQVLFVAWQMVLFEALLESSDRRLAEIAAKTLKEIRYHWRFSRNWLVRLGDGTTESHDRVQSALDTLWKFTRELFTSDEIDVWAASEGIAPDPASLREKWSHLLGPALVEATLEQPADTPYDWFGKRGEHTEHLGFILAEMQHLQRTHPGATW